MRIASYSWGGRHHVGIVSSNGQEVTPLAAGDAGALALIEALSRGEALPAGDVAHIEVEGLGAIENHFE